jgi:hypothetical protein
MKVEDWNGHSIRFVERSGEWWAVAKDVCEALGFPQANGMAKCLDTDEVDKFRIQCDRIKNPIACGVENYDGCRCEQFIAVQAKSPACMSRSRPRARRKEIRRRL